MYQILHMLVYTNVYQMQALLHQNGLVELVWTHTAQAKQENAAAKSSDQLRFDEVFLFAPKLVSCMRLLLTGVCL
jgi:hypothetical protein